MKLEYNYHIGPHGIEFSLIDGFDDDIHFDGTPEQHKTVQRYIMQAWQDAINKSSSGPEEIRELMSTIEGQVLLQNRARDYLATLLADFPPELERRKGGDRRDHETRPRGATSDRRTIKKRQPS